MARHSHATVQETFASARALAAQCGVDNTITWRLEMSGAQSGSGYSISHVPTGRTIRTTLVILGDGPGLAYNSLGTFMTGMALVMGPKA